MMRSVVSGHVVFEKSLGGFKEMQEGGKTQDILRIQEDDRTRW